MKVELVAFTESLGFDLCRIAPAEVPPHVEEFREWLAEGRAGSMEWLGRNAERRTDPQVVLPGAQSVIVLGMNYWKPGKTSHPPREGNIIGGRIARYAWGDDYHEVIECKLRLFDEWLRARGGFQKTYVDTGPMLERDFAGVAGAGWQGKSTMLLHPKFGPWLFLSEVLTTLSFEADQPMRDHCGKCTACLDACPTQAITSARQLDARRCISYLTIENKGSIPEEFRAAIGDRIYGCDECLDVCPWNRFAREAQESAFTAREYVHDWSLRDFLGLDDDGFGALFRKSPIKRIKRRGFLRNVCVALGNVGTKDDLPALQMVADDPEPLVAEHARWAIKRIRERIRTDSASHPAPLAENSRG